MTEKEIAVLGYAFFDGKTLQYRSKEFGPDWVNWIRPFCPAFNANVEWRIKPEYPKTITICTFVTQYGSVTQAVMNSAKFHELDSESHWTRIKSLDQVVAVE